MIGDINLDGQITADLSGNDDFSAFIADWRSPSVVGDITIADLNEDRIVDLRDFAIFRQAVLDMGGAAISLDAFYTVPEPGAALLSVGLLAGLVLFPRSTRGKHRTE